MTDALTGPLSEEGLGKVGKKRGTNQGGSDRESRDRHVRKQPRGESRRILEKGSESGEDWNKKRRVNQGGQKTTK